mgnify:CR=1 FL=1
MTIGKVCNRELITVNRESTALNAAKLMRQHHVGDVIVVETKGEVSVPIGIVTDRDIVVELVATELNCNVLTAGDIMVTNLAVIHEDAGIYDAIKTMTTKGVRRLPVVDNDGGLTGIITLDDLILLLAKEFGTLAKLVAREQKNEISKRP